MLEFVGSHPLSLVTSKIHRGLTSTRFKMRMKPGGVAALSVIPPKSPILLGLSFLSRLLSFDCSPFHMSQVVSKCI